MRPDRRAQCANRFRSFKIRTQNLQNPSPKSAPPPLPPYAGVAYPFGALPEGRDEVRFLAAAPTPPAGINSLTAKGRLS